MKARTMRAIDWYVGVPLCYLLVVYESVRRLLPRYSKKEVKTVLFIKFFGIGSIILSTPAVQAAREAFPGAAVHYLTFSSNREVLALLQCVDRVHTIDPCSVGTLISSTLRTMVELRRTGVDIVFDLEFFAKFPLVIATVIGARRKAGFYLMYESWRRGLLDDLGYYNHYWHVKDIFLSLVYLMKEQDPHYLRFSQWTRRYNLHKVVLNSQIVQRVTETLRANGWRPGQMLLLLNPNAGKELAPALKRWIDERWVSLTERLLQAHPDAFVVYTGVSSEAAFVERIITSTPQPLRARVRNSAGQYTLAECAALFSIANLFVTIDSGPMHLAALTDIPIVGLFFAETPDLYAPLSANAQVVKPDIYGLPSFTVYMGKDSLLPPTSTMAELVSVEEVFVASEQALKAK